MTRNVHWALKPYIYLVVSNKNVSHTDDMKLTIAVAAVAAAVD